MIKSFRCRRTKDFWESHGRKSRAFGTIAEVAMRKLRMIDAVTHVEELRCPPGNRLEALTGNRAGQYSIRINDQYRVCFRWQDDAAYDVEIADYH